MPARSDNFMQALDAIRDSILAAAARKKSERDFPLLDHGPAEDVLVFASDERMALQDLGQPAPYFSSRGTLTDLDRQPLRGGKVEGAFQIEAVKLGNTFSFPPPQSEPWHRPPIDPKNTTDHGFSKRAYFFGGEDSLVTVGPGVEKISGLKSGGAQFWIGSIGVVAQGTGKYAGAEGIAVYIGSAHFPRWPPDFPGQGALLAREFSTRATTYLKVVLAGDLD